jgi:hypothetical protein
MVIGVEETRRSSGRRRARSLSAAQGQEHDAKGGGQRVRRRSLPTRAVEERLTRSGWNAPDDCGLHVRGLPEPATLRSRHRRESKAYAFQRYWCSGRPEFP